MLDRYKKDIGDLGEKLALKFLTKNGYEILDRNYNTRFGEIDIIAKEGNCISFIEVKTRTNDKFGAPANAVARAKQLHMTRTAKAYIAYKHLNDYFMRFDIVEVILENKKLINVNVIKNAFEAR